MTVERRSANARLCEVVWLMSESRVVDGMAQMLFRQGDAVPYESLATRACLFALTASDVLFARRCFRSMECC